jgi:hypothetical protein
LNCWETGGHDLGECVGFLEGTTLITDLLNVFKIHDMTNLNLKKLTVAKS